MPSPKIYAGIDIGGTKIAAGLVTDSGKMISRVKTSTPKDASFAEITTVICDLLEELIRTCAIPPRALGGIGVGIPGLVDPLKGKIIRTPNMSMSGVNLPKMLKKKFRVEVEIGNDVNLGLLGEKWLGAARKAKNVVGLFVGTGVGSGVLIDNRLLLGAHGVAAELGHTLFSQGGPLCHCGHQGCLEAYVGRWAIERDLFKAMALGKKTILKKMIDRKSKFIKSRTLFDALKKKDPLVTKVMNQVSRNLGVACLSIRRIFDPEMIVLGGGVMEACGDSLLPVIRQEFYKDKFFAGIGRCEVVLSQLGDNAVILGAVALLRRRI